MKIRESIKKVLSTLFQDIIHSHLVIFDII